MARHLHCGTLIETAPCNQNTLRLVAPNLWVLDHLCRATSVMAHAAPPPHHVAIDLTHIRAIDASAVASLMFACAQWRKRGVSVTIEGCNQQVAEVISRAQI